MPSPYVDSITSYTEDLKIVAYQILVLDPLGMGKIFAFNIFFLISKHLCLLSITRFAK